MNSMLTLTIFISLVTPPHGCAEIKHLTRNKGETIELDSFSSWMLKNDTHLLWSVTLLHQKTGQKVTLIDFQNGTHQRVPPEDYKGKLLLDGKTGALTIGPVGLEHSGVYQRDIYDGDELLPTYKYNITVLDLHPAMTPGEHRQTWGRHHIAVIPPFFLFGVAIVILPVLIKRQEET